METPVRNGGTGQIARLLDLRNAYRFSKYFLAPTPMGALRTRRRILDHPQTDTPRRSALVVHTDANRGRSVASFAHPAFLGASPGKTAPGSGYASLVARRTETESPNPAVRRPGLPIYRPETAIRKLAEHTQVPGAAPIGEPFQTGINRFIMKKSDDRLSQTAGLTPPRSAAGSSAEPVPSATLRAVSAEAVDTGPATKAAAAQQPFVSGFETASGPAVPSAQHSPAGARNGIPQGPRTGTLHIDGATLGRWTIQHLERTLGKPSAGMTGVDPRATIPRSRVAPF